MSTFERSLLGTTISYEGLAEHGKRYIPKLAGRRVPDAFRRLSKKVIFFDIFAINKSKKTENVRVQIAAQEPIERF